MMLRIIYIIRVLSAFVSKQMVKCYDMVDGNAWAKEILVVTPQEYQNQMVKKQKKLESIRFNCKVSRVSKSYKIADSNSPIRRKRRYWWVKWVGDIGNFMSF